ncbi:protein kinase [Actinoallomurus sp. NPDC050550]|uniref:WD40 repeat domain-containing serine/threonine protein kinase n=1 Tax=Actinoallomurus sp. NPDC050550 TaxID=3154937 RepID=UPI003407E89D
MVDGTPDGEQELISGRYRLVEVIAHGGMGTVWRGHDEMLDREVAIKRVLFPPDVDDDERAELTALALREARATARLNHSSVVTIYDVIDDGSPVIVMELIEGRSLADILREEVRLPYRRVAEIGAAVLDALREAHAAGIVHRDLKPANILITDRRIVLTDFGVAQRVGERAQDFDDVLGTPAFMAPEQAENAAASPAADLWSLGAVMFNAVEGRPPFQGPDHATVLLTLLTQEVPALVNGGPLKPLIAALLIKDPDRRPTAEETAARLKAVLRQDDGTPSAPARPALSSPDSGKDAGTPSPGKPAAPPASGTTTPASPAAPPTTAATGSGAAGAGGPSPTPKPTAQPGALPRRPHYVRHGSPPPRHLPAQAPSSAPRRFWRGPVVAGLLFLGLYLFAHIPSSGSSSSGVNPSSSPFDGFPPYTPPAATPSTPTTPETPRGFEATAISPDGDTVAFAGNSGVIRLYGTTSHKQLRSFKTPDAGEGVKALTFSPDGQTIAAGLGFNDVEVWDIAKRKERTFSGFDDELKALRFSTDGQTLIAAGGHTAGTWNVPTAAYRSGSIPIPKGGGACLSMTVSPSGYVACGYDDTSSGLIVWDAEKGTQVSSWPGAQVESGVALSPDGRTLAFNDQRSNGSIQVWDIATHREKHVLPTQVLAVGNSLVFGTDGDTLAVPTFDASRTPGSHVIQIWDVSAERKLATIEGSQDLYDVAFSPDGVMLAAADFFHGGVLWNLRSGKKLASWTE